MQPHLWDGLAGNSSRLAKGAGPCRKRGEGMATVQAYAALRSASGRSRFDPGAPVTTTNVREFHADPETRATAARILAALGFTVAGSGPLGVSFSGPADLFERIFRVTPAGPPPASLSIPDELAPVVERVSLSGEVTFWDPSTRRGPVADKE